MEGSFWEEGQRKSLRKNVEEKGDYFSLVDYRLH